MLMLYLVNVSCTVKCSVADCLACLACEQMVMRLSLFLLLSTVYMTHFFTTTASIAAICGKEYRGLSPECRTIPYSVIGSRSFENMVAKLKYLGNAYYHSVQNLLSFCLSCKNFKIKIHENIFLLFCVLVGNLVSYINGRI